MKWKADLAAAVNRLLGRFDIELVRRGELWHPLRQLGRQPAAPGLTPAFCGPFFKAFHGDGIVSPQQPFDFAVIIPTTLRPTLSTTLASVFEQRFVGTIQVLVGVDTGGRGELARTEELCRLVPERHSVLLFYPGYSTSRRHGGLNPSWDGGALRTLLSYLANSRYLAYLDDDNWWSDDHLTSMHSLLSAGAEWTYSLRWFVHPGSRRPICRDEWESVGPNRGYFRDGGGWVDPNCLALDKIACEAVLRWWSIPSRNTAMAMDADRNVFQLLRTEYRGVGTGQYSVFYALSEADPLHSRRLSVIGEERYRSSNQGLCTEVIDGTGGSPSVAHARDH